MDLQNLPTPLPARPPSVEILVRTYHGDELQLRSNLIPTLRIFVNRREFPFVVVLDEETNADRALGERIFEQGLCDRVVYERLPPDWKGLFQGVAFPPPYNRWGYDRQQWSTFYMDVHSDRDVLGVADSDATFYTYLTRQNIFSEDGRIILSCYRPTDASPNYRVRAAVCGKGGCVYRNDPLALGEAAPYDCIMTNRMPIWFWRSTYAACRNHIARKWSTDFDTAFKNFSRGPYCTFNILANYAIKHEPDRYKIRLLDSPDRDIVSVAQNGCLSPLDLVAGGLRTFRIARDERLPDPIKRAYPDLLVDTVHLNRLAYNMCGVTVDKDRADRHYAVVGEEIDKLSPQERNSMREAFLEFVNHGLQNVKVVTESRLSRLERIELEIKFLLRNHPVLRAAALRLAALASRVFHLV